MTELTPHDIAKIALRHGRHTSTCECMSYKTQARFLNITESEKLCDCGWSNDKLRLLEVLRHEATQDQEAVRQG